MKSLNEDPRRGRPLGPFRRVLFFGKRMSRTRATGGLVEALRAHGLEVRWINLATLRRWLGRDRASRRARRVCRSFRPDLLFVFGRDLPQPLLEELRGDAAVVAWIEDPLANIDQSWVDYLSLTDAAFVTNGSKVTWLHAHGVPQAAFVLEGFSSRFHHPDRPRREVRDVAYIGGPGRDGRRAGFLVEIARRFDLTIHGNGWADHARRYPELRVRGAVGARGYRKVCATSRIVLGLNQVNDDLLYFSNRTFFSLACRAFHLTHYVPHLEAVFADGVHLAWFRDLDECVAKITHYLERPAERARIAQAGHDHVVPAHEFHARIAYVLGRLARGMDEPEAEPWAFFGGSRASAAPPEPRESAAHVLEHEVCDRHHDQRDQRREHHAERE